MAKFDYSSIVESSLAGRNEKKVEAPKKEEQKTAVKQAAIETATEVKEENSDPKKETYEFKNVGIKLEGKKKRKKLTRSVYIYEDLYQKLSSISADTNLSISDALNKILDQVL